MNCLRCIQLDLDLEIIIDNFFHSDYLFEFNYFGIKFFIVGLCCGTWDFSQ